MQPKRLKPDIPSRRNVTLEGEKYKWAHFYKTKRAANYRCCKVKLTQELNKDVEKRLIMITPPEVAVKIIKQPNEWVEFSNYK